MLKAGVVVRQVLAQFANPAAAFIAGPILARALGPADRGSLAAVLDMLMLLTVLCPTGLPDSAALAWARDARAGESFLRRHRLRILAGGVAGVVIAFGMSETLFRHQATASMLIRVVMIALPVLVWIEILRGSTVGAGRYASTQLEAYIAHIGRLAAVLVLGLFGLLTPLSVVVATVAFMLVGAAVYPSRLRERPGTQPQTRNVTQREGAVAWQYWLGTAATTISTRSVSILLLSFASATDAGLYAIALSLPTVLAQTVQAIRLVLFRFAARDATGTVIARVARIILPAIVLAVVVLEGAAKPIVLILFGERFAAAVPVVQVALLSAIPVAAVQVWSTAFSGLDRPGLFAIGEWMTMAVTVVGTLVLGGPFGALGAACAVVVASLLSAAWSSGQLRRLTGLTFSQLSVVQKDDLRWLYGFVVRKAA